MYSKDSLEKILDYAFNLGKKYAHGDYKYKLDFEKLKKSILDKKEETVIYEEIQPTDIL